MERKQDDLARDMQESDQAFRAQFDPSDPQFHHGITAPVPIGGARVPESMPTEIDPNYAPPAEPDTPEYTQMKTLRTRLGEFKKELLKCGPLIEIRMNIAEIPEEEKRTELYNRNDREVDVFERKMAEFVEEFAHAGSLLHVNYRLLVDELRSDLYARYDTKEAYSNFAHKLKVINSKVFKDMSDLLQRMKQLKKQAIPVDLNEFDSYSEIVSSLEKLERLFESITDKVSGRVSEYQSRLHSIESRICVASQTIQHMEGSGRGFHILSKPTFPKVLQAKGTLFPRLRNHNGEALKVHVQDEESYAGSGKKSDVLTTADLLSALNVPAPNFLDKTQSHVYDELGDMPHSLMYASSILVFHSTVNPYQPEVIEPTAEVVMAQEANFEKMAPPPPTLLYGEEAWRLAHFTPHQDLKFQPTPQIVNRIHLPQVLELPNIAMEGSFPEVIKSEWDMTVVPSVVKAQKSDVRARTGPRPSEESAYDDSRPLPRLPDVTRSSAMPVIAEVNDPKLKAPFPRAESGSLDLDVSDIDLPDIHSDPRSLRRELPPRVSTVDVPPRKTPPASLSAAVEQGEDPVERLKGQVALRFSPNMQPLQRADGRKDEESMSVWTESEF